LIAGVRGDVAVKVFGDDLPTLLAQANRVAAVLRKVPGAADVKVEQVTGLPTLTVEIDRTAASRFGLNVADIQAVVRTALAGSEVGAVFEGDRRFDIVVRLPESVRNDLHALERLPVPVNHTGGGVEFVPLDELSALRLSERPNQVSREYGKRRVVVQANVRGRDLGGFVSEAQDAVARGVR